MDERSLVGQEEIWSNHDARNRRTRRKILIDLLVDVQEELMDALLYIEAARRCLT